MNKKTTLIILLTALTLCKTDPKICTAKIKGLFDSIMTVALSMEKNNYLPSHDSLKSVLSSIEEIIENCANSKSKIPEYYGCFDRIYLILPSVQDLTFAVLGREWDRVVRDSGEVLVELVNGITYCVDVQI